MEANPTLVSSGRGEYDAETLTACRASPADGRNHKYGVGRNRFTSGDITGMVTDRSEATVPKATVTLTNVNTNATENTITSSAGERTVSLSYLQEPTA